MNLHSEQSLFKTDNQLNQLNYSVSLDNKVALPIHIQNLEKALNLNSFLKQVHSLIDDKRDDKISLTLNKQQSKDVKSSMYSFNHNKAAKGKNGWLKNILIDNSDESDNEDIGQSVQQLLKIRKYKNKKQSTDGWSGKPDGKIGSLSSNILSLNDSVPLSSLFKSEKSCKSQIKKPKTSKKKLKSGDPISPSKKPNDKPNDAKLLGDRPPSYVLNSYFEPTLNSKPNDSYTLKKDYSDELHQLDSSSCLEASKLLDDIKYETTLADEMMLHGESNMNDFVNSFLTNMNDQIIYSNQLPDEIFETEEEISNGFHDNDYDLLNDKLTASNTLAAHCELPPSPPLNEPPAVRTGSKEADEPERMNGTIEADELNGNLGENLSENLTYNVPANEHRERLTSNSESNPNSNSNEVKKERTENGDDHESEPIERLNEHPTSDQPTDSRQATLTKIHHPINVINSTTPINSINSIKLANLVDSQMTATTLGSTINGPIISASLPVNLIGSLPTSNLNGPVLSGTNNLTTSTTLSNPATLSNGPSKLIEPSDAIVNGAIVNGALTKAIAKKKVASKVQLAEIEPEQMQNKRKKLWSSIAKKDIPKAYKSRLMNRKDVLNNCKKLAHCCLKERSSVLVPKLNRERSKKSNKEIATYWKLNKRNENSTLTNCEPSTLTPVQASG